MATKPLSQVRRRGVEELKPLIATDSHASATAGRQLLAEARDFGLNVRDYLDLVINPAASEAGNQFRDAEGNYLSGYEATLATLNLPVQDDFKRGIVLEAAADTFQTFPGTRAVFPEVVDDLVKWKYRQEQLENTAALVSQSRTINGVEMISTVINDTEDDYQVVRAVAELGRVPVRSIRMGQTAVAIYKHGGGLRMSYEFQRRARLDILTPYQVRMDRETERSKVLTATQVLINGDGANPAAPVVTQSSFDSAGIDNKIHYKGLLGWLLARAKAGVPIDTVAGNWDSYLEWLLMFAIPGATSSSNYTDAEVLARTGFQIGGVPILNGAVNFVLSSGVPDGRLVGFSKGDTLEELIEAGSNIEESERAIQNQSITFVKTENSGYKLAFGDTRSVYNWKA
jgi:hypothetical protein